MDPQLFPSLEEFRRYMVTSGTNIEVIKQTLYDTLIYPTAGATAFRFFQNPVGQGVSAAPGNGGGNPKTLADTNMTNAGALPSPQGFFVQSIEVDFQPGSVNTANTFTPQTRASSAAAPAAATGVVQLGAVNDVSSVLGAGFLQFNVGSKNYLTEGALLRFPPKARFELDAAMGGNSATTANFAMANLKAGGRPYMLTPSIAIMTSQNFEVVVNYPVVVATPSGFNGAMRVILDGWLFRAVQ